MSSHVASLCVQCRCGALYICMGEAQHICVYVSTLTAAWVPVLTPTSSYSPNAFGAQVFAREHALCAWWRDEVPVSFKTAVDISRAPILSSKLCQGIHTCLCDFRQLVPITV